MVKKVLLVVALAICSSPAAADLKKEIFCTSLAEKMKSDISLSNALKTQSDDLVKEMVNIVNQNKPLKEFNEINDKIDRVTKLEAQRNQQMADRGTIWMAYCKD